MQHEYNLRSNLGNATSALLAAIAINNTENMKLNLLVLCAAVIVAKVSGHGYLVDPPGRASAWRYGFDTPVDYNDNECFCGGFNYQYEEMGGKCGICGDDWNEDPREHEVGSIYATGTLVRNYTQGQLITAVANVTVNHLGHFEYKICANNDVTVEATQECLDLTPLYPSDGNTDMWIGSSMGTVNFDLQLPADLICSQCVFQWRYVASNTWGTCENGTEAVGCGPQEEFRGCADVSIQPMLKTDQVESLNKVAKVSAVLEQNEKEQETFNEEQQETEDEKTKETKEETLNEKPQETEDEKTKETKEDTLNEEQQETEDEKTKETKEETLNEKPQETRPEINNEITEVKEEKSKKIKSQKMKIIENEEDNEVKAESDEEESDEEESDSEE